MEQHSEIFDIKRVGKKDVNLAQQLFKLFSEVFEWENPVTASDAYLKKNAQQFPFSGVCSYGSG